MASQIFSIEFKIEDPFTQSTKIYLYYLRAKPRKSHYGKKIQQKQLTRVVLIRLYYIVTADHHFLGETWNFYSCSSQKRGTRRIGPTQGTRVGAHPVLYGS